MVYDAFSNSLGQRRSGFKTHLRSDSVVDGILEMLTYEKSMLRFLVGRRLALEPQAGL